MNRLKIILSVALLIVCARGVLAAQSETGPRRWHKDMVAVVLKDDDAKTRDDVISAIRQAGGNVALYASPGVLIGWIPDDALDGLNRHVKVRKASKKPFRGSDVATDKRALHALDYFNWAVSGAADDAIDHVEPYEMPADGDIMPHDATTGSNARAATDAYGVLPKISILSGTVRRSMLSGHIRFNLVYMQWAPSSGIPEFSWNDPFTIQGTTFSYKTWGYRAASDAMTWWASRYNTHFGASRPGSLNLIFEIGEYTVTYAPNDPARISNEDDAIRAGLTQICSSCPSTADLDSDVEAFNDSASADNALTSFIFLNPQGGQNPPLETFGIGRSAGYTSRPGGAFSKVRLFPDGGYGRTPSLIAHETGHTFFACDEYSGRCACSTCEGLTNYNQQAPNKNCADYDCSYGHKHDCIMKYDHQAFGADSEYGRVCEYTRQSIGWWHPTCFEDSPWDATTDTTHWKAEYFDDYYSPRMPLLHWLAVPRWTSSYTYSAGNPDQRKFIYEDFVGGISRATCHPTPIASYYSIRYRKKFAFNSGTYPFTIDVDEGYRFYIDDVLYSSADTYSGQQVVSVPLTTGSHELRLDYFHTTSANGHAHLSWADACPAPPTLYLSGDPRVCAGQPATIHGDIGLGNGVGPWQVALRRNDGQNFTFNVSTVNNVFTVTATGGNDVYTTNYIKDTGNGCVGGGNGTATVAPPAHTFGGLTPSQVPNACAVQLTWDAATNSCNGGYTYKVERFPGGTLDCVSTTSYLDSSVVGGTKYIYQVTAADGPNCASNLVGQAPRDFTPACPPPASPSNVAAAVSQSNQVVLNWNAVSGATSYSVERRSATSGGWVPLAYPTAATYTDGSVSDGAAYAYRVRAYNGAYSDPAGAVATLMTFTPIGSSAICPTAFAETLSAINLIRAVSGAAAVTWGDILQGSPAPAAPGSGTHVVGEHVLALRRAMDSALTALGVLSGPYSDSTLPGSPLVAVKGSHLRELQQRARQP